MKRIVFYHASCADGFGAAFAAWKKFNIVADYVPVQYGQIKSIEDLKRYEPVSEKEIYVLDFSFPPEVMRHLADNAKFLCWLDHHKTAFESLGLEFKDDARFIDYDEKNTVVLDNTRSGALIAWEFFHPNTLVPPLFQFLDDYDRWQFKLNSTKEINKALWAKAPWSFEQWDELLKSSLSKEFEVGKALLQDHEARVKKHVEKYRIVTLNGVRGYAINAPGYVASDTGHIMAEASKTFGMSYFIDHDLTVKCSLRSVADFDVSALAKTFGGGGHKNAAGFTLSIQQLKELLENGESSSPTVQASN